MRKYVILVLSLLLIFGITTMGLAHEKEGKLSLSSSTNIFAEGGRNFELETNCPVGFILETTPISQTVNGVTYELNNVKWSIYEFHAGNFGPLPGPGTHGYFSDSQLQNIGKKSWLLKYKASTGENISDLHSGRYSGNVTVTITSLN